MAKVTTAYPAQLAARTSQRNPTAKIISGNVQNLNGATSLMGGSISDSPITNNLTIPENLGEPKIPGSIPIEGANEGTDKSDSSGSFLNDVDDTIMLVDAVVLTPASNEKNNGIKFNDRDDMQMKSLTTIDYDSGQLNEIVVDDTELILDGELTSNEVSWTEAGSVVYAASGATLTSTGASILQTYTNTVANRWVRVQFTIESLSGVNNFFSVTTSGNHAIVSQNKKNDLGTSVDLSNGTDVTYYVVTDTSNILIKFETAGGGSMIVSDVSMKELMDAPQGYANNAGVSKWQTSGAIDDAAHPSKDTPGELQFHDGSKTVKQADYSAKYSI